MYFSLGRSLAAARAHLIWILAAVFLFILEMALLVWPVGWLEEDLTNYLTGAGAWDMEAMDGEFVCSQRFSPENSNLANFGIVISGDEDLQGGNAVVTISDAKDRVLFETSIPYEEATIGAYTDIDIDSSLLRAGKIYYLSVRMEADERGRIPVLRACSSTEYPMAENIALEQGETLQDAQLVTRYRYKNTVSTKKFFRAFCICIATALGIVFFPKNRNLRRLLGVMLLIAGPWVLGRRLELLTFNSKYFLPFAMKWNMGVMYLFELIVLLCTQSFRASVCVSNLALTLLYTANYFVFSYRGQPLRLNDLTAVGTAAEVVGNYSLRPNSHMAMAWCICCFFVVHGARAETGICWKAMGKFKKAAIRLISLLLGTALVWVSGYQFLHTDILKEAGFVDIHGFDQNSNYVFNGYLVTSLMDIRNSGVKKPEGYSRENVGELLRKWGGEGRNAPEGETKPHIILIMNESFSDLRVLGNLQTSEENLAFFNGLEENVVKGYVNASVIGGGTANSEFEVFTGCSLGFLPLSYYPYQQCMTGEMPSLVSNLKEAGYTAYSMHPESKANWNRGRVYQYLGFDKSLWIEDFPEAEKRHFGVTDLETYKKVEELYENREPGEKLFVFDLTIQNHGGYSSSEVERSVTASNVSSEEADTYLSLIQKSDEDFRQLITYFEKEKEPVLICMFGDHQPKLEDSFYENVYGQTEGIGQQDKTLNMYKTPFLIWANYDIPERSGIDISMNYLGILLADTAGIKTSPFFDFLRQYMEEYPIITVNGYIDDTGNYVNWSGENDEHLEYRQMQYYYLFD